jgi:hypothetical protein
VLDVLDADVDALPSDATTDLLREEKFVGVSCELRVY